MEARDGSGVVDSKQLSEGWVGRVLHGLDDVDRPRERRDSRSEEDQRQRGNTSRNP